MKEATKNKRPVKYWQHRNGKEFVDYCKYTMLYLAENFNYRINEQPMKITSEIDDLVNKKQNWYKGITSVYYHDDIVYFVQYQRNIISVEYYCEEGKGCRIAHAILAKKKNEKKSQIS